MTADELRLVPAGASLYVPDGWDVVEWIAGGFLVDENYYVLIHPPDRQNSTRPRRPYVVHTLDLLSTTTNPRDAWQHNHDALQDRAMTIYVTRIKPYDDAEENETPST